MLNITMTVNGKTHNFDVKDIEDVEAFRAGMLKKVVKTMKVVELVPISSCFYRNKKGVFFLYCKVGKEVLKLQAKIGSKEQAYRLWDKVKTRGFIDITKWK